MRITSNDRLDVAYRDTWRQDKAGSLGFGRGDSKRHFSQAHLDPFVDLFGRNSSRDRRGPTVGPARGSLTSLMGRFRVLLSTTARHLLTMIKRAITVRAVCPSLASHAMWPSYMR